jgi:hypothetical protein
MEFLSCGMLRLSRERQRHFGARPEIEIRCPMRSAGILAIGHLRCRDGRQRQYLVRALRLSEPRKQGGGHMEALEVPFHQRYTGGSTKGVESRSRYRKALA